MRIPRVQGPNSRRWLSESGFSNFGVNFGANFGETNYLENVAFGGLRFAPAVVNYFAVAVFECSM